MIFRLNNTDNEHARPCVNCGHVALAGELHECPALVNTPALSFEVVCPAGTYHRTATLDEAQDWAEWGHACVAAKRHAIFEVLPGFGWVAHQPKEGSS